MSEGIIARLRRSAPVRKAIYISKKIVLPGFDKLPIYYVAKFFFTGLVEGALELKASSLAFKFFLAIFPTIIFLLTLIPFIPIDGFRDELLEILNNLLPEQGYQFLNDSLINLITNADGGLLSFGFIFALYLATSGFDGMQNAFMESYNTNFKRSIIRTRLVSVLMLFILTILLVVAISAILISEYLVNFTLEPGSISSTLLIVGKWIIIMALCFFCISVLYYLGGNRKMKWKFFSAGSSLATFLVIIVSLAFGFYVDNFANYNKIYGSIGTIIILMLWIYFNSFVLLIGFELNASIQQAGSIERLEDEMDNLL
ncbi:MAG: ribonuclease BN [Flavobacteriales bacterium]|nr:ribonuclease BN [Flavobacteriales bacterium]|tara:strand:- start:322 stop:1263 length:942 start_codon:yes stop_codon:yes gene_type:complete